MERETFVRPAPAFHQHLSRARFGLDQACDQGRQSIPFCAIGCLLDRSERNERRGSCLRTPGHMKGGGPPAGLTQKPVEADRHVTVEGQDPVRCLMQHTLGKIDQPDGGI